MSGYDVPAGAWDCHTHVFGPYERFPLAEPRAYSPPPAPVEALEAHLELVGVEHVVLVQASSHGSDTRAMDHAVSRLGSRARSVPVVDPAAVEDYLLAGVPAAVRGLRLNLHTTGTPDLGDARRALQATLGALRGSGLHLQLFADPTVVAALSDDLAVSSVPVVLDHLGLALLGDAGQRASVLRLAAREHVWIKLSAPERSGVAPDDPRVDDLVAGFLDVAADRLVWGSDWPHSALRHSAGPDDVEPFRPVDDRARLRLLARWAGDRTTQVLVTNPARLYG